MLRHDAARFWQKIEAEILPLVRWLVRDRSEWCARTPFFAALLGAVMGAALFCLVSVFENWDRIPASKLWAEGYGHFAATIES